MNVSKTQLKNGLSLLCCPTHDAPVVALQAWVRAGAADETDDNAGIAHVHEHMLFKGTLRRGVGQIAQQVEGSGGEINAWTSHDQTVYHIILASSEWKLGLDILADALQQPAFDPGELSRELEVIMEEIRRSQDIPARRVSHALFSLAYARHPYGRPVLGFEKTVRGFGRDQVLDFFKKHYRPDLVTLIVTGDIEAVEVVEQVKSAFGSWSGDGALLPGSRTAEPAHTAAGCQILHEPVKEARLALAWQIPAMLHPDIAAIDALAVVLGHSDASRLFERTRRQQKLVNDVYAYAYTPTDPGLLTVGANLQSAHAQNALNSILEQCFALRLAPVSDDELACAKTTILSEASFQGETVQGLARRLGFFEVVCGDYAAEKEYHERIRALTPKDLQAVAETYLLAAPSLVLQIPTEDPPPTALQLTEQVQDAFARFGKRRPQRSQKDDRGVVLTKLDNGTRLLLREEQCPVVAFRAVTLGGQRWEKRGDQGHGSFFASVWGLASQQLASAAMARRVAELGGSLSAFSGRNTLGLRGEFVAENARRGLDVFLDALLRPDWNPADCDREKKVALEHIRNREDHPQIVAFDAFAETLFPGHPYGHRLQGVEESISHLTPLDLAGHYQRFVGCSDLVISVTGGVDIDETTHVLAEQLRAAHLSSLGELPSRDPFPTSKKRVQVTLAKQQAHLIVGAMGTTIDHADRYVLDVLTTVLSGQGGRLFADLRDQRSLAYSVSASNVEGLDPGHVLIYLATAPDKVEQALAGIHEHLDRLRQRPPSADEVARAQRYLVGAHAIDLQRTGARAMTMGLDECCGLGYANHQAFASRIRAITGDDVLRVAQQYLPEHRLVEVIVGPG